MNRVLRQGILKYLAASSLTVASTVGALKLADIPTGLVIDVVDESEDDQWDENDRDELLLLLAHDERKVVRHRVSTALGRLLGEAGDVERTTILAEWATAPESQHRLALGFALLSPMAGLATEIAVQSLAEDRVPHIRHAAADAAAAQYHTAPGVYRNLLQMLAEDEDPHVRRAARRSLRSLSA